LAKLGADIGDRRGGRRWILRAGLDRLGWGRDLHGGVRSGGVGASGVKLRRLTRLVAAAEGDQEGEPELAAVRGAIGGLHASRILANQRLVEPAREVRPGVRAAYDCGSSVVEPRPPSVGSCFADASAAVAGRAAWPGSASGAGASSPSGPGSPWEGGGG